MLCNYRLKLLLTPIKQPPQYTDPSLGLFPATHQDLGFCDPELSHERNRSRFIYRNGHCRLELVRLERRRVRQQASA